MKTINDFKKYYNEIYQNTINLYEKSYITLKKEKIKKFRNISISLSFIFLFLFFVLKLYTLPIVQILLFVLIFIILILTLLFNQQIPFINKISYDINKMILFDIISFIIDNKELEILPDKRISKEHFQKSHFFNLEKLNYNGENFISFLYQNTKIILSDIHIYNYKYKTKVDSFYENGKYYKRTTKSKIPNYIYKGIYIELPFNKENDTYIYMISNNFNNIIKNKIDNSLLYKGERVFLENANFEDKYNVYCDDQIKARYICSLSLMEELTKDCDIEKENTCIVLRPDNKISLFLKNITIEKLLRQKVLFKNNKITYEYLENFFGNINILFQTIDVLQSNIK